MNTEVKNNEIHGDYVGGDKIVNKAVNLLENTIQNVTKHLSESDVEHDLFSLMPDLDEDAIGLEQKLAGAQRSDEYDYAVQMKNMFDRILAKHKLHGVKMGIYTHALNFIISIFKLKIWPLITEGQSKTEIDAQVYECIVLPLTAVLTKHDVLATSQMVHGMVFSLTGACHLKWSAA